MDTTRRSFLKKAGLSLGLLSIVGPLFAKTEDYYTLSVEEQEFITQYEEAIIALRDASILQKETPGDIESGKQLSEWSEKMGQMHAKLDSMLSNDAFKAYFFSIVDKHAASL